MITVEAIRNGATILSLLLKKIRWADGKDNVRGKGIGEGAKTLGLAAAVDRHANQRQPER